MKYVIGALAFGAGVPIFLVGVLTLNPGLAAGGAFMTITGLQQLH